MPATNVKSKWVGGDLYFYDKSGNEIFHIDGTNRALVLPSGSVFSCASLNLDTTELGLLDGATAGSITASKVVTRNAAKNIPFFGAAVAALGTNQGTAAAMTADLNVVTAADGTVGVALPTATAGMTVRVVNTVTNQILKVYPATGAAINALAANSAFSVGPGKAAVFHATSATQWYVEDQASITATSTEINVLAGVVVGTASASKAAVLDANKDLDAAALRSRILGVGNNYKVARGQHQQAAASDTIVTGLTTVVAVAASFDSNPTVKQLFLAASIGDQAGTPAAGSILLKTFKPTAVNDVTPTAATDFSENLKINWVAIGT